MDIEQLLKKAEYLHREKLSLVEEAYEFASKAHRGQLRRSGEPYLQHPLEVASILADLQLDATTLAAGLLHDVPEDCGVSLSEIEARFGPEIRKLVDGVTKLSKISWRVEGRRDGEVNAENMRRMLVAMAEDLRVVFIKLADRLHNMRTLSALPPVKRQSIARETMEIYAPLSRRLGIWEVEWQLEDLSLLYLEPQEYHRIARLASRRGAMRENLIPRAIEIVTEELEKAGLRAEVTGRPKNIYSIYRKMKRYASQDRDFSEIYDIVALRVIVDRVQDCYEALGAIHNLWHPIHGEFNDYIANPKENGYQSLHSTVMSFGTVPLEIQIRTREMHHIAEYGVAAHWCYKEGTKARGEFEQRMGWLRQLIEWHRELSGTAEFLESVKTDIFNDQVFIYTPKGEIKDLPAGSTPLDFAYRIHTDLGHRCIGAKVNGRLVSLNYALNNGDTVEILIGKEGKGPSRDWLNPNLGYIKTSHARTKIRQWFKKRERAENIERGKEILGKELHRLAITVDSREEIARLFKFKDVDDLYAALGYGEITPRQIALRLVAQEEQPQVKMAVSTVREKATPGVQVMGVGGLLTHIARCCHPVPGDEIVGYITRSRGVSIHRKDCPNIVHQREKDRLASVEWGPIGQLYPVGARVEAWDRVGLIRDITSTVAAEGVNIAALSTAEHDDHTMTVSLTLEIRGVGQLSRLLAKLDGVRGVIGVTRTVEEGVDD